MACNQHHNRSVEFRKLIRDLTAWYDLESDTQHRYQCVVEYDHPIKSPVHASVKFVIEKDSFVLLDADGAELSVHIDKRERVLLDPKSERQLR